MLEDRAAHGGIQSLRVATTLASGTAGLLRLQQELAREQRLASSGRHCAVGGRCARSTSVLPLPHDGHRVATIARCRDREDPEHGSTGSYQRHAR